MVARDGNQPVASVAGDFATLLEGPAAQWSGSLALSVSGASVADWSARIKGEAFAQLHRGIVSSGQASAGRPLRRLRSDEIVWGRVPVRLDLGGGWSDTPPYSLEHGGCVINAAVDLNGQPPIQAYARGIDEPVIRLASIDQGKRLEVRSLEELLDYRNSATSDFGLAKGAMAMSGLSPQYGHWPEGVSLEAMLRQFGGGLELTTLSAVPKGSGLGTSSILGAVILAVVRKTMGLQSPPQELFHGVLRLEQLLTTGGGWQDQVGAVVGGVKVVSAREGPCSAPDHSAGALRALDGRANGGRTLLYYTGITRLAKGILRQVVGHYLDRDRRTLAACERFACRRASPRRWRPAISRASAGSSLGRGNSTSNSIPTPATSRLSGCWTSCVRACTARSCWGPAAEGSC